MHRAFRRRTSRRSSRASTGKPSSAASAAASCSRSSRSAPGVTYSNNFELGLKHKQVVIPGGVVNTASIEDLLRTYVASARMQPDFDKLPIPFRAVATDMVTGDMVVLKDGDLATAMRASMAIPGAFAPVVTDKYILADGGMVRNIPVDVARDLCAENVIVVNLRRARAYRARNCRPRRNC